MNQFLGLPPAMMPSLKWLEPEVRAEIERTLDDFLDPQRAPALRLTR